MAEIAIRGEPKLLKYEEACRAIAEAKTVDEAKDWKDKAAAIRAYARQIKNQQLEIDAAEIRVRAERRLGELLALLKLQGKYGARGKPGIVGAVKAEITSEKLGLNFHTTKECGRLARLPEAEFNSRLEAWRRDSINKPTVFLPLRSVADPGKHASDQRRNALLRRVNGRPNSIEQNDLFDQYRMIDGRKYGDVLFGELGRLIKTTAVQLSVLKQIKSHVANADDGSPIKEVISAQTLAKFLSSAEP